MDGMLVRDQLTQQLSMEGRKKCLRAMFSKPRKETQMVNLYIHERREEDVAVPDLKGRIKISGGTLALHRSIRCLGEEGKTKMSM
jgi:hypothetical protein